MFNCFKMLTCLKNENMKNQLYLLIFQFFGGIRTTLPRNRSTFWMYYFWLSLTISRNKISNCFLGYFNPKLFCYTDCIRNSLWICFMKFRFKSPKNPTVKYWKVRAVGRKSRWFSKLWRKVFTLKTNSRYAFLIFYFLNTFFFLIGREHYYIKQLYFWFFW